MYARRDYRGALDRDSRDVQGTPRRPGMYRRGQGTSATLAPLELPLDKTKSIGSDASDTSSLPSPSSEDGRLFEDDFMPSTSRSEGERRRPPNAKWTMMDGIVRKADKGKVKNCKEDIDTLLVFAGLFSAVLTAFVVESYHNLQPDTSTEAITLLRQISLQLSSYTINTAFANATHSVTFVAPPPMNSAVLVNALWFASLILSLITASLAMLVKQWLHEYLAGDYYSPQARLRIRQFRHDGMRDWYVIEIAAVLPLLLQISLGLFFLGLCNFTFSVNSKVGWTTTPLVVAWLLLVLLTIAAPIVSPRCPYKVTFLVNAFRILRKWIGRLTYIMREGRYSHSDDAESDTLSGSAEYYKSGWFEEERDAVTSMKRDLHIFLDVDAMLADDHLVDRFYRDQIKQLRSPGPDVVDFVLTVMGRRTRQRDRVSRSRLPMRDLRPMSKLAWVGLTGILADAIEDTVVQEMLEVEKSRSQTWALDGWMKDALKIVMSDSGYTFQSSEANIIVYALLYDCEGTISVLRHTKRSISPHDFTDIVDLAQDTLRAFDADRALSCMLTLGKWAVSRYSESLCDVLQSRRLGVKGVMAVARVLVGSLAQELNWQHEGNKAVWGEWFDDALGCVVHAFSRFEVEPDDTRLSEDMDNIAGVVWRLCAEDTETMAKVVHHLPEHESTADESSCSCLFAAAIGHSCIVQDARSRIIDNFEKLAKSAIASQAANNLQDKLYDIARCMRGHKTSYASEVQRWRAICSILRPSNHGMATSDATAVDVDPPFLRGLSREPSDAQPVDDSREEDVLLDDIPESTQADIFDGRPTPEHRCSSPIPLGHTNFSGDSDNTAVDMSLIVPQTKRAHANTMSTAGAAWDAGYGVPHGDGSSPRERGFGERDMAPPMQSTPKRPRGRAGRLLSPLRLGERRVRSQRERAKSLDSTYPDMTL
ncbi:hypothetical protein PsYK624_063730 [Phanerochaete sordida]|uniref:DUF6535 domain-containing protein n=1 Tax=Phanerochaete sordida TaxID=48140 RepID=A0A9P3GAA6_9APHY|nr:hypothetical protein PsYK624_063730 [Phanerochaete sordida]